MFALDFSFGLGRWGIKEADVVELERRAKLGECLGILGEENGVIINVDLQRASVGQESDREEIEVGQEEFTAIDFGGDEESAAVVDHIEHGEIQR
jgi:hypothetical protein